jgi:uncharacterized protein (UPF0248 family)
MNKIRDILNEIKWRHAAEFAEIEVWYIHRGAIENIKKISGKDIISIEKTFLKTTDAMIPHHRISKIFYKGTLVFDRERDT